MTSKAALVAIALDPYQTLDEVLIVPGVFIAVDAAWSGRNVEFVGTFVGWSNEAGEGPEKLILDLAENKGGIVIPLASITQAYWAPAGYRPDSSSH